MPRKYLEPRRRVEIWLPESIKARLDLICLDPLRGKPDYGKRSELIQQLLQDHFNQRQVKDTQHDLADRPDPASGSASIRPSSDSA